MTRAKVAISLDREALERVDRLVRQGVFPSRSRAIEAALEDKLDRLERHRLAREAAKLDPAVEQAMAEEGMSEDLGSWPGY